MVIYQIYYSLSQFFNGVAHAANGLFFTEEGGEGIHVGTLTLAHEADAPGVPGLEGVGLHPGVDSGLLGLGGEVGECLQLVGEGRHFGGRSFGPVLTDELVLAVEGGRSLEEEVAEGPEVAHETDVALLHGGGVLRVGILDNLGFHQADDLRGLLGGGGDALLGENVEEGGGQGLVGLLEKILAVEPPALHIVELGAVLGAFVEAELVDEFLHGENFLVGAGVPAE